MYSFDCELYLSCLYLLIQNLIFLSCRELLDFLKKLGHQSLKFNNSSFETSYTTKVESFFSSTSYHFIILRRQVNSVIFPYDTFYTCKVPITCQKAMTPHCEVLLMIYVVKFFCRCKSRK